MFDSPSAPSTLTQFGFTPPAPLDGIRVWIPANTAFEAMEAFVHNLEHHAGNPDAEATASLDDFDTAEVHLPADLVRQARLTHTRTPTGEVEELQEPLTPSTYYG